MSVDLDTLHATGKTRVQKSEGPGYMSILHAVPMKSRTKVQKSMPVRKAAANKPKQPAQKAVQPQSYKPAPESAPGSTIGNTGHPNATSNVSGAPEVTVKPSGIEVILAAAIEAITSAVKVPNPVRRDTTPQATAATLAEDRRRGEAEDWNSRRSAAQRMAFTFHAAKSDSSMVNLGKSANAVRMYGTLLAPAPMTARKAEERRAWFNDTYMARLGRK